MEPRLALHGIALQNREADSVPIHDNASLYDDLDKLIRRQEPLEACRYCLGSWARSTPNKQLNRSGVEDFLTRKSDELADLVNPIWIVPRSYTDQSQ
jgi:hypothetical protein